MSESKNNTNKKCRICISMRGLKSAILSFIGIMVFLPLNGQVTTTTFTTSTTTITDAMVRDGQFASNNFGGQNKMNVDFQFGQQVSTVSRTFIKFDLSSIPTNAIITAATLNLTPQIINNGQNHPIYVERVNGGPWTEGGINWNNQPGSTDQLSFTHQQTSDPNLHQFDVMDHVQHMTYYPSLNEGWKIQLQQENGTTNFGMIYHSSEANNTTKRPTLTISYVLPLTATTTITHCTAGNTDGTLSTTITGGGPITTNDIRIYEVVRDPNQRAKATLTYISTANLNYTPSTGICTANNLAPGIYLMRVYDPLYLQNSDTRHILYKQFLVGREGETTKGILMAHHGYNKHMMIERDESGSQNPTDKANKNYYENNGYFDLLIADIPGDREAAALFHYDVDFDNQLKFTKSIFYGPSWGGFYRHHQSSNAVNYSIITSDWEMKRVTWNTRPSIDINRQINIPTTTTIGFDPNNIDTVAIDSFINYWQANPTQNFGFEVAMASYNNPQMALRGYFPNHNNRTFLELEFTVKAPVETIFDEETATGTLTVNAPSGHPLPYKYLISYESLPDLNTLWQSVKDSIPVDSLTFFAGNVQTTDFTFEGLDPAHYYVGVYDNTGAKIMDGEGFIAPPINLLNNTNISVTDGVIARGSSSTNGTAMLDGLIRSSENGGFEFEVQSIGNMTVGFNNLADQLPQTGADMEFGISVFSDGTYDLIRGNTILYEGSINVGSDFKLLKQNNKVHYYVDGVEVFVEEVYLNDASDLTGTIIIADGLAALDHLVKFEVLKVPLRPMHAHVFNPECDENIGRVQVGISKPEYYGGTGTYIVRDVVTGLVAKTGSISELYTGIELAVGEYRLEYTYTVGGSTYIWSEYFDIGHPIFWDLLNPNFTAEGGTVNTITSNDYFDFGLALSQNELPEGEDGWVSFNAKFIEMYPPPGGPYYAVPSRVKFQLIDETSSPKVAINMQSMGLGLINKYVWAVDASGATVGTPFTTYRTGEFKIRRDGANFETYFNNSLTPFATLPATGSGNFKALAYGRGASIFDSYASFCYGLTTSKQCAHLDYELDGNYYVTNNGRFCFVYNEEYNDPNVELNIYNQSGVLVATEATFDLPDLIHGQNRLVLDFTDDGYCLVTGFYTLEVINDKNEKFYLRFYNDYSGCGGYEAEPGDIFKPE